MKGESMKNTQFLTVVTILAIAFAGVAFMDGYDAADKIQKTADVSEVTYGSDTLPDFTVKVVGGQSYETLNDAIAVDNNNPNVATTIELLGNVEYGNGVKITSADPKNIIIDLKGFTYTVASSPVGSTGTETQGFHFEKGSTVVIKNGTLKFSNNANLKMGIQNYCDLTLEDVIVDASEDSYCAYAMSNNNGAVIIKGSTSILAYEGKKAFDVCVTNYYPDGAQVSIDTIGTIKGIIEYDVWGSIPETNKTSLTIKNGIFDTTFSIENALKDAAKQKFAINGGTFYNLDCLPYIQDGKTVTLGKDVSLTSGTYEIVKGSTLTIPTGKRLTVSSDATFVVKGNLVNNGTIIGNITADAKNGNNYCGSLADAVVNAEAGDSLVIMNNVDLAATVVVDKGITIDLNDHTITGKDVRALQFIAGDSTITGTGTITSEKISSLSDSSSVIRIGNNASPAPETKTPVKLTIGKDVTVSTAACYGISVFGSTTTETLDIYGTVQTSGNACAVSGNGTAAYAGTTINIMKDALVKSTNDVAIYHPQAGTLSIKGTVEGLGGVEIKSGSVMTINGDAKVTATGEVSHSANNNGTSTVGYAFSAVENNGYAGNPTVTINGGKFVGPINIVVDNEVPETKKASITITAGTFSTDVSEFVIAGKTCFEYGDAYIVDNTSKAKVSDGTSMYLDLYSALLAGKNTYTLLADATFTEEQVAAISGLELDEVMAVTVGGNYKITSKDITVPSNLSITFDGPTVYLSGKLIISKNASLTGKVDFSEGNTITFTNMKAGNSGFSATKGSVIISGDMGSGRAQVTGQAKVAGTLTLGNDVEVTVAANSSLMIPSNTTIDGSDAKIINNGAMDVYGTLSTDVANTGSVMIYANADVKESDITGNGSVQNILIAIEPIEDMDIVTGTFVVIYLSAVPETAKIETTGASWLSIDGHVLKGYAPNVVGTYTVKVSAYLTDGSTDETATESFNITVREQTHDAEVHLNPIGNMKVRTGSSVAIQVTTTPSDAKLSIQGASWLSVYGHNIVGTAPQEAGEYTVTVTASIVEDGNTISENRSFKITVESKDATIGFFDQDVFGIKMSIFIVICILALVVVGAAVVRFI